MLSLSQKRRLISPEEENANLTETQPMPIIGNKRTSSTAPARQSKKQKTNDENLPPTKNASLESLLVIYPQKYTGEKNDDAYLSYFNEALGGLDENNQKLITEIIKTKSSAKENDLALNPQIIVAFIKKLPDFEMTNIIKILKHPGAYEALAIIAFFYDDFKKIINTDTDNKLTRLASHYKPAKELFHLLKINKDNTLSKLVDLDFSVENILDILSNDGGSKSLQEVIKICFTKASGQALSQFDQLRALGFTAPNIADISSTDGGSKNLQSFIQFCLQEENGCTELKQLMDLHFTKQLIDKIFPAGTPNEPKIKKNSRFTKEKIVTIASRRKNGMKKLRKIFTLAKQAAHSPAQPNDEMVGSFLFFINAMEIISQLMKAKKTQLPTSCTQAPTLFSSQASPLQENNPIINNPSNIGVAPHPNPINYTYRQ